MARLPVMPRQEELDQTTGAVREYIRRLIQLAQWFVDSSSEVTPRFRPGRAALDGNDRIVVPIEISLVTREGRKASNHPIHSLYLEGDEIYNEESNARADGDGKIKVHHSFKPELRSVSVCLYLYDENSGTPKLFETTVEIPEIEGKKANRMKIVCPSADSNGVVTSLDSNGWIRAQVITSYGQKGMMAMLRVMSSEFDFGQGGENDVNDIRIKCFHTEETGETFIFLKPYSDNQTFHITLDGTDQLYTIHYQKAAPVQADKLQLICPAADDGIVTTLNPAGKIVVRLRTTNNSNGLASPVDETSVSSCTHNTNAAGDLELELEPTLDEQTWVFTVPGTNLRETVVYKKPGYAAVKLNNIDRDKRFRQDKRFLIPILATDEHGVVIGKDVLIEASCSIHIEEGSFSQSNVTTVTLNSRTSGRRLLVNYSGKRCELTITLVETGEQQIIEMLKLFA